MSSGFRRSSQAAAVVDACESCSVGLNCFGAGLSRQSHKRSLEKSGASGAAMLTGIQG